MTLSPELAAIAASLDPTTVLPQSEHATDDELAPCPYCNRLVWHVTVRHAGTATQRDGTPLLLEYQPTARGRYLMTEPGFARWCHVIDLIDWPLPRYASHYLTCEGIAKRKEEERELRIEQMRWAKAERAENKERQRQRREAFFTRLDREMEVS